MHLQVPLVRDHQHLLQSESILHLAVDEFSHKNEESNVASSNRDF